jgi:hypothetical protein
MVVQQKNGRPVQFELMSDARGRLLAWLERRGGTIDDYAFPSRIDHTAHMSTRQYARLFDEWVAAIGLRPQDTARIPCAAPRRPSSTRRPEPPSHPDPGGHTKIEYSVRYLGVDVEDALELAETTEV